MSISELRDGAAASAEVDWSPKRPKLMRERAVSLAIFVGILALWWAVTASGMVAAYIVPPPQEVLTWLISGFSQPLSSQASFTYHTFITMQEAFYGFVIGSALGIVGGMALAHWPAAERIVYPYVVAFQALPKVAIAPLLVVWFGFGLEAKVLTVVIMTFFPLLVNSIAGYHAVEADRIDLARAANATQLQIFRLIILPSAAPFIFAGLHMAAVIALLAAIVAEFVGAQAGLGLLLLQYNNSMQMGGVFAILVILGVIGFVLNYLMQWLEAYFCFWVRHKKNS